MGGRRCGEIVECGGSRGVHIGVDGCMYVRVLVGAVCVVYICAHACT